MKTEETSGRRLQDTPISRQSAGEEPRTDVKEEEQETKKERELSQKQLEEKGWVCLGKEEDGTTWRVKCSQGAKQHTIPNTHPSQLLKINSVGQLGGSVS